MKDICKYHVAYLEEKADGPDQQTILTETKKRLSEKGFLPSPEELKQIQDTIFNKNTLGGLGRKR